jgi:VWFA-related protein
MNYKNIFNLLLVFLLCSSFVLFSNTFIQAQSAPKEKPQLKDFGSSIKSTKNKNNKESDAHNTVKSKKGAQDTDDVIKIETKLVRTDVLVVNQQGKAILGLKATDFIVTENDVPQEIGTFSLGENVDVPKSIVLIMDYSGSQIPFIKNSVEAAKVLVDKLNPKDQMAIVTDDVELLVSFTNDKKILKKKLDDLKEKANIHSGGKIRTGKSLQFSALFATLNEMFHEEDIRPMIIFQSDGDEIFSVTNPNSESGYTTRLKSEIGIYFTTEELFSSIEKSRATIYSVITDYSLLGLSPEERLDKMTEKLIGKNKQNLAYPNLKLSITREMVQKITERLYAQQMTMMIVARASGGFTESLETPQQADAIYTRILNDINNRYLIGYYPKNEERDGKRRTVKIEVKGHPEYIVWGRKTYTTPKPEN